MPTVEAFSVCVPEIERQRDIVRTLGAEIAEAERLLKAAEDQLAAINAMPAAVLRRAFSGAL
jgi:type I restriction enzyme S subunit